MNNFNSANSKDIITQVLQEILQADPHYFLPKQFHVLTWKSKKIEGVLITKINGQRYLGLPKKDKNGQTYWSYKLLSNPENQENQADSFAKFQPKSEKVEDYDQSNSAEPAVNS